MKEVKNPKTFKFKEDFINFLASMSPNDVNDFIKQHGKGPKIVNMCKVVEPESTKEE